MDVSILGPLTSLFVTVPGNHFSFCINAFHANLRFLPVILGIILLHEPITLKKVAGVILAFAAIYILSTEDKHAEVVPAPKDDDV